MRSLEEGRFEKSFAEANEKLLAEFVARGIVRGNELYLRPLDALELLHRYDAHGIAVIGAEAAVLEDSATRPCPELIADFSSAPAEGWGHFRRQCTDGCTAYLNELPVLRNLFVTLVPLAEGEQ
jgi:hypothetical protein